MPHWMRMGVVVGAVAVALVPASPGDTGPSSRRPEEAGSGATSDEKPGTGSTYWTEERMKNAKPAEMPNR